MSSEFVNTDDQEGCRVLVADDERDLTDMVKFCLEQEGFAVRTANNGYEALGAARAWHPRVVLLDVMMPMENGYRVSRYLKEDAAAGRLPLMSVVLVTARKLDDPEREQTFSEFSRADSVLYKPFDMDELVGLVRRLAEQPAPAVG